MSVEPARADAGQADATLSASQRAAETGQPVEVVSERTPYTTTKANPDGTYTLTQSTSPQRVQTDDDSWQDVDPTLVRRPDGTVGPKAAVVDLSFSGGGDGKGLIRIGNERGSLQLGWPGRLPEPALKGATATYPEIFEGVDPELTATAEGYQEVLVVKSAQAAVNANLEQIELSTVGQGLQVLRDREGGMRAVDEDGNTVFDGPAGLMWDSSGRAAADTRSRKANPAPDAGDVQDANVPMPGDASAEMRVKVERGAVSVKPDLKLLRGKDTVYPVRI